jgi:hypothetical protein
MNKKILIISLIIVLLIIITIASVLIIKYQSTSKTITPGPAPTPTPVPVKSQTFNIQNYSFGGVTDTTNNSRLIFTKSGTIKSFTSNLSISTNTTTYNFGTNLEYIITSRGENNKPPLISAGVVYFPPNPKSSINTQLDIVEKDLSVQQGDELIIGNLLYGNATSGTLNGTVTVNFI